MDPLWRWAPWFTLGSGGGTEPLSYRVWKRLWQVRGGLGWEADLFERMRDTDWDLLVVMDACRYDVLREVAETVAVDRAVSPATATYEFLTRGAESGAFDGVTYVSGSPQTEKPELDLSVLCEGTELVSLASECWDPALSTVDPTCVLEVAEERLRAGERVITHIKQPHYPHITGNADTLRPVPGGLHPALFDEEFGDEPGSQRVLSTGAVRLDRAEQSYRACARFAWDLVRSLAERLSAEGYRVAVTADHGEAFGEWGFVEHPVDVPIDTLREVPWVVFDPLPDGERGAGGEAEGEREGEREDLKERLQALGYRD